MKPEAEIFSNSHFIDKLGSVAFASVMPFPF